MDTDSKDSLPALICEQVDAHLVGIDPNNWPSIQGGESVVDTGEWRSQLPPDSRQRLVNKIMDTLKRHIPFHGADGLQELEKIATRFEEKIYSAATSQTDYLREISLKMLAMETESQNNMVNHEQPDSAISNNENPQDPDEKQPGSSTTTANIPEHSGE